jgi:hypothetical protein
MELHPKRVDKVNLVHLLAYTCQRLDRNKRYDPALPQRLDLRLETVEG